MKPIIVKIKEDGTLDLTIEELQKFLDDIYKSGYEDGVRSSGMFITQPVFRETGLPNGIPTDHIEITCGTSNNTSTCKNPTGKRKSVHTVDEFKF